LAYYVRASFFGCLSSPFGVAAVFGPNEACWVYATRITRRGLGSELGEARRGKVEWIPAPPEVILEMQIPTEAVLTRHDMARTFNRSLDDPWQCCDALVGWEATTEVVRLTKRRGRETGRRGS